MNQAQQTNITRRGWLRTALRTIALVGLGGVMVGMVSRTKRLCTKVSSTCRGCAKREACGFAPPRTLWQLDPTKCIQCGLCATSCVLEHSAVRCFHTHAQCGYCKLCFGYFEPGAKALSSAAENQLCPTGAIRRTYIEDPYFEIAIDKALCIGCGKCVHGCKMFGNGSLYLQIDHSICLNCNECAIATACPADAFSRVPYAEAYTKRANGSSEA